MALKMFAALIALGIPLMVQAYSAGAPSAECSTMMPRHHVDAQKGAAPYDVILAKNKIRSGETVKVTIKGKKNDQTFKGLIVQARVGNTPIGAFDVSPSNQYIQLLDCGSSRGNAITHKKMDQGVNKVDFFWTAPNNLSEKVTFVVTVAQNGGVFWVQHKSDTLSVN